MGLHSAWSAQEHPAWASEQFVYVYPHTTWVPVCFKNMMNFNLVTKNQNLIDESRHTRGSSIHWMRSRFETVEIPLDQWLNPVPDPYYWTSWQLTPWQEKCKGHMSDALMEHQNLKHQCAILVTASKNESINVLFGKKNESPKGCLCKNYIILC